MEAYKKLPKKQHEYWDKFKEIHSEGIVKLVKKFLGEEIKDEEDFIAQYAKLSTLKGQPSKKRKAGRKTIIFLKKNGWVK